LGRIEDKIETSGVKIAELDVKIGEIVELSGNLMDEYQMHHSMQIQVDTIRRECEMLTTQRVELGSSLHEYQGTVNYW
jgi:hypothetical protein